MSNETHHQATPDRTHPAPVNLSESQFLGYVATAAAYHAPAFLPRQRWFGDKARSIAAVRLTHALPCQVGTDPVALAIVSVAFTDGPPAEYFLPLALTTAVVPAASVLAPTDAPANSPRLVDALALPAVRAWLLDSLAAGRVDPVAGEDGHVAGAFAWRPSDALAPHLPAARLGESRLSSAEQSNSAIVYAGTLLLKVFRKLQPGLNPDIEIGRFLTERTGFRNLPPLLGDLAYEPADPAREPVSLAMAQPFISSIGDGWQVMLDHLAAFLDGASPHDTLSLARRVGERTAQLHLALASDPADPVFAPEPIGDADTLRWIAAQRTALERTIRNLRAHADAAPASLRSRLANLEPDNPTLTRRREGIRAVVGAAKTRVHGDYHLGQLLCTPDGDVVILDFEGEPARPLDERRAKTSPLIDVAGLLRSFAYARAATRRTAGGTIATERDDRLVAWEEAVRAAFLDTYLAETRAGNAPFLPADDAAVLAAVAAWELDKAVYEVNYELNNRPDWLELPLSTLLDR